MNNIRYRQIKVVAIIVLTLIMLLFGKSRTAASEQFSQFSPAQLYELAFRYANNKDYVNASIYLFAYTQVNPPEYANNVNGHKTNVDRLFQTYNEKTQYFIRKLNEVNNDLIKCGRYPCDQASTRSIFVEVTPEPLPPPPNAAILCTDANFKGNCKLLYVGDYNSFPQLGINDLISSVMVGSQVKLTLFLHANFTSQPVTFTANDPDLSNNRIDNTYNWNDNASAAKVQYK